MPHLGSRFNDVGGLFPVENFHGVGFLHRGLLHEHAAEARVAGDEELAHEVLFHVDVLIEEFGEGF